MKNFKKLTGASFNIEELQKATNELFTKMSWKQHIVKGLCMTQIPGDPSSAAFFTALTLLKKNSYLKIQNVGLNPTRIGFYTLLKKSGAKIKFFNKRKINNEVVGDIFIKSSTLRPINAPKNYYLNTDS